MLALMLSAALAAAPAPQPEALMLGLRDPDGGLSTWFVDARGARRLGRGLRVPRPDGPWLVDVSNGEVQEAWVRPLKDGTPSWWKEKPAPPKPAPDVLVDGGSADGGCETSNRIVITFASAELLTMTQNGFSDCGVRLSGQLVMALTYDPKNEAARNFLVSPAPVQVLGPDAEARFQSAAKEEAQKNPCVGMPAGNEWQIVRTDGQWIPMGHAGALAPQCRGVEASFDFEVTPPPTLVGDGQPVNREKFLAEDRAFVDAVASPSGRIVVVLETDQIAVRVNGKTVATTALTPAEKNLSIVMTQWVKGAKEIERLRK